MIRASDDISTAVTDDQNKPVTGDHDNGVAVDIPIQIQLIAITLNQYNRITLELCIHITVDHCIL